jgi:predicted NBD/HSP70 family sugar kinase
VAAAVSESEDTGRRREVLALDIGGTKLAAGIIDATGRLRDRRVIATDRTAGADVVLGDALGLIDDLVAGERWAGRTLRVLGVSTNGLTREDGVDLAPAVGGWEKLQIPGELRRRFPGLRTCIVNDVKAATAAEMTWGALRGVTEGLYVNLGTGLAAGIVAGGRLQQGAHGAAGEIGYIVPSLAALAERQPGQAVELWTAAELGRPVTAAELLESAQDDPRARELRERLLDEIALWVANVAVVLDPSRVVLGGGMVRSEAEVCDRVQDKITTLAPFAAEVYPAHFGAESALLGAGAFAHSGESELDPGGPEGADDRL